MSIKACTEQSLVEMMDEAIYLAAMAERRRDMAPLHEKAGLTESFNRADEYAEKVKKAVAAFRAVMES